jgi:hypothetical protein
MRANKIMTHESILQVLGEAGCPFCRLLTQLREDRQPGPARWSSLDMQQSS